MAAPITGKVFPAFFSILLTCFSPAPIAASPLFEVLDRDDSGYITLEETENTPEVLLNFSALDQNKNDQLEEAELQLSNIQLSFEHLDVDEDLLISYDEATALPRLSENFNQLDQNNDQSLTPEEFEASPIYK